MRLQRERMLAATRLTGFLNNWLSDSYKNIVGGGQNPFSRLLGFSQNVVVVLHKCNKFSVVAALHDNYTCFSAKRYVGASDV